MGRVEGEMNEERLRLAAEALNRGDGVLGKVVGGVVAGGKLGDEPAVVAKGADPAALENRVGLRRVEEVHRAVHQPVVFVEAAVDRALRRLGAEVPLAAHRGLVAGGPHGLGDGGDVARDGVAIVPRIHAGEERGAGRGALRVVVELVNRSRRWRAGHVRMQSRRNSRCRKALRGCDEDVGPGGGGAKEGTTARKTKRCGGSWDHFPIGQKSEVRSPQSTGVHLPVGGVDRAENCSGGLPARKIGVPDEPSRRCNGM